ncbi:trehalose-phosphatase [Mycobacterium sp.]|uniref:trehalose-phosphatase n=1 Tax=Mycobacterium sp. TaxID=1785 RepID=UPI002BD5F39E|nr:trehalose-phosphatase [Mycobacterium sp.]HME46582.1 trehalose-phosphatase [Mycobacterium sp.]
MQLPVTIDPRYHDAVLFDLDGVVTGGFCNPLVDGVLVLDSMVDLVGRLHDAGIATAAYSSGRDWEQAPVAARIDDLFPVRVDGVASARLGSSGKPEPALLLEAARRLDVPPERSVVIEDSDAGAAAGRDGGFGLVIVVDGTRHADEVARCDADAVVADLRDVTVRTGDKRMSEIPNALESYGQLVGIIGARKPVAFFDFDGTLSEIVSDPDTATLVDGAAEALEHLAADWPVVVLSGRDLVDVQSRVGIPGIWYAGSDGLELTAPDGSYHQNDEAAAAVPTLERATGALSDALAHIPGVRLEHKRFAVAVHYREVAPERVAQIVAATYRLGKRMGLRASTARKVIELRPDIEWDKGATLAWIRGLIDETGSLLPVYLGDDLTDEAAFDAVRFDGIGIVVRHRGDSERRSAAHFTLEGPEQAGEFVRQRARWLANTEHTSEKAWDYTFDGYDPPTEKLREALCTVGNGYFASRGAAPESKAGQVHYPGSYAAGVYNRLDDDVAGRTITNESLVNLPNWLPMTFRVDGGSWFDIDAVKVLAYRQTLDLRGAVLTREFRFRDEAGRTSSVIQKRFVAMHMPHVGALAATIVAEDWSGTIEIRSTIDGGVSNSLVERYRDLASKHLTSLHKRELSDDSVLLTVQTTQSHIPIAVAARTTVRREDDAVSAGYRLVETASEIGHDIAVELAAGQSVTVEKIITIYTGRDVAIFEPAVNAQRSLSRLGHFGELLSGHRSSWSQLWERLSIELEGHADELRILRLHLLHLLQTVSYNSADLDGGAPARGLHGEAYRGHIFWDDLFIFPVLNLRLPTVTRSLLLYRHRRLPEARRAAKAAGYAGAMFPWQSGSDGREESQQLHLNPRSGRWNRDSSALAQHIGIAVAYNAWKFYQVTGDLAYLIDYGAELLVEIARFWVSRASYDEERDRYSIRGVIGPDEFHSGYPDAPYDGVDNNAYTNVMAVWVILRALDALQLMPLPNRLDLRERLGLRGQELAHWDRVSRRMFVPFHDGVISQFEGYGELAELDWDDYRRRYGSIQRLDRILEAEDDDVNRYKASKQADALMLLYLMSATELGELLDRLGYRFTADQVATMVDYYIARTSHGSTLSGVVHAWVLARANRDHAMELFQWVLKSDVADIQGGTTSEGVHLAAMAGSVDLMQRCFTGMETRQNRIILNPNWPETLGMLAFPFHYRGLHLHLRVSGKGATVSADPRHIQGIEVEYRGRVRYLTPGTTITFSDSPDDLATTSRSARLPIEP